MILLFSFLTFISTFLGGLVGLRLQNRIHLILGFTAGALLGLVAFDLLPEIIKLVQTQNMDPMKPMIALVIGFLAFHILEKFLLIHHAHEDTYGKHKHPNVGIASALALICHSFSDGIGIGLGFHVSNTLGLLVGIAVIAHDFSDGLNTVSLTLVHKNSSKKAVFFLILDALAPVLGALSTSLFTIPDATLTVYFGFFAGFLLYIGASDILPEAHSQHSSYGTIAMTIFGTLLIYTVTQLL